MESHTTSRLRGGMLLCCCTSIQPKASIVKCNIQNSFIQQRKDNTGWSWGWQLAPEQCIFAEFATQRMYQVNRNSRNKIEPRVKARQKRIFGIRYKSRLSFASPWINPRRLPRKKNVNHVRISTPQFIFGLIYIKCYLASVIRLMGQIERIERGRRGWDCMVSCCSIFRNFRPCTQ